MSKAYQDYSLWDRLRECGKPIFLYGTGNGGDKIISALERYGIELSGVFASDGFVRDRYFHSFRVRSYSDTVSEYGDDIVVLLAFGTTLPSVYEFISLLDRRHELYIPDVPLYGGELFDMPYFLSHRTELDSARELLSDEKSKKLFSDAVSFRLSGRPEYLRGTQTNEESLRELYSGEKIKSVVDGGAFRGDSSEIFARTFSPGKIYAFEPDPKTFLRLSEYAEREKACEVIPINAALSVRDGESGYSSSGSRGAGEDGRNRRAKVRTVRCVRLDTALSDERIDFVKLDIEGEESAAISGGERLISRCEPNMAVSLYHRTDDLFSLIFTVHSLLPSHKLYLRRPDCIPMWDLTLYAVR